MLEKADRDATLVKELGLSLCCVLNTHVHADHVTGSGRLRELCPGAQSAIAATSGARADRMLSEGDVVSFGARHVRVMATPGHTSGCLSFVLDDASAVFTGDALLIRGCGRTDFQGGSSADLYDSVTRKLFALPGGCAVYPAHDYSGCTRSSIADEKSLNPRLGAGRTLAEFEGIMDALQLPRPKLIDLAVPANLLCGLLGLAEAATITTDATK